MAQQSVQSHELIPVAVIAWRDRNNYRKNYGEGDVIRNSLAERQWVIDNPVPVCAITEEEKLAELTERKDKWHELKTSTLPESGDALKVFELLYTVPANPDNPDGERVLIEPKYSGNAGFRRARNFFGAMVQRFTRKPDRHNPEPDTSIHGLIPVRIAVYKNRVDRIIDQQLENEMQMVGTKKMEDLEKLRVTYDLFCDGCRESQIRRLYSSSVAQKAFNICLANENWPELKILDRFYMPSEDPNYIPWGAVLHADLIKFNNRFEAQRKVREGLSLSQSERGLPPIDAGEVDSYFRDKARNAKDGNSKKIMSKTDMEGGTRNHPLLLVRNVFDSVLNNTQSNLEKFVEFKDALNAPVEMVRDGKGEQLQTVMTGVKTDADLLVEVSRLIAAGKGAEVRKALEMINNPASKAPKSVKVPATASK